MTGIGAGPSVKRSRAGTDDREDEVRLVDQDGVGPEFTVVVPVFNSEDLVETTIDGIVDFFDRSELTFQLVLVNDGSVDGSWEVIRRRAEADERIVAINLLRNYGQHNANLCGFREARGRYVITMDDDGQNPPEEIGKLIATVREGHDVVFGAFERKQTGLLRRLGSRAIGMVNRRVFNQPSDLVVSNFRIMTGSVARRIAASQSVYPYITGQALLYSASRANVTVRHEPRRAGSSNYSPLRIARLVLTILFSYSSAPLHMMAVMGILLAASSFLLAGVYVVRALVVGTDVEGWTSLVVLTAFFNGVVILMLSMLGEYAIRTLNQVTDRRTYHVVDRVGPPS